MIAAQAAAIMTVTGPAWQPECLTARPGVPAATPWQAAVTVRPLAASGLRHSQALSHVCHSEPGGFTDRVKFFLSRRYY